MMAEFGPAFSWFMQFEQPHADYEPHPDKCPNGCAGPCFALAGINSAVWPITFAQVKAAPLEHRPAMVEAFYAQNYWNHWLAALQSQALVNSVVDMAVNAGMGTAVRLLQTVVSATPDGIIGPATVAAVNLALTHSEKRVVIDYANARISYYDGIDGSPAEHNAWRHRAEATCTAQSLT